MSKIIEYPLEEVRKKQVKEKLRRAIDAVPAELWQELTDDIIDRPWGAR